MTYPDDNSLDFDTDDSQDDDSQVTLGRKQIRSMERDAKQARKHADENARLQRELAFTKAGIDTDADPKMAYFLKGYDGEITAEAIRSAAESAGFLTPSEQQTNTDADLAAYDRVSQASAGTSSRTSDEDRKSALMQAQGQGREALLAEMERQGMKIVRN